MIVSNFGHITEISYKSYIFSNFGNMTEIRYKSNSKAAQRLG